jgi:FkbM family methyltransferase
MVTLFNNKKMLLEVSDRGLSHDLLFDSKKHREPFASSYLINVLSRRETESKKEIMLNKKHNNTQSQSQSKTTTCFVDIGCNLGYYSILLSDYFDKIVGVEPVKSSGEVCIFNAQLNDFNKKFTLVEGAITPTSGVVSIGDQTCKNLVKVSEVITQTDSVSVSESESLCKGYTLSEICQNNNITKVDFMKMDVEGYEYNIIVKGKSDFFKYAPKLFFLEIHFDILKPQESIELLRQLKNNGYYVDKAFSEIKVKTNWLGPLSSIYEKFIQKYIMKNKFGELYSNTDISLIMDNDDIIKAKHGAIEFIFKRD